MKVGVVLVGGREYSVESFLFVVQLQFVSFCDVDEILELSFFFYEHVFQEVDLFEIFLPAGSFGDFFLDFLEAVLIDFDLILSLGFDV